MRVPNYFYFYIITFNYELRIIFQFSNEKVFTYILIQLIVLGDLKFKYKIYLNYAYITKIYLLYQKNDPVIVIILL